MCVLVVKPQGAKMPDYKTLVKMKNANPDGFGYASKSTNFKTMDFTKFMYLLGKVDEKEACIIHFRLATHGSIKKSNCHPFYDKDTDTYFAHNGILPFSSKNDKTDSEICFRERLVPVIKKYGFNSNAVKECVESVIGGSKFALMKGNKIRMFGHFTEIDGVLYSNTRWQTRYSFAV